MAIIFSFSSNSRPKWLQDRYQLFPPPQRVLVKGGVSLWLANDRFVTPTTTALDISFQFLLLSWTLSNLDRPRMIDSTRSIRGSVAFWRVDGRERGRLTWPNLRIGKIRMKRRRDVDKQRAFGTSPPRIRPVIAFVCSQGSFIRLAFIRQRRDSGPLRKRDKCIYVVNLPGNPHPPFKLTPVYPGILVKLRGSFCDW